MTPLSRRVVQLLHESPWETGSWPCGSSYSEASIWLSVKTNIVKTQPVKRLQLPARYVLFWLTAFNVPLPAHIWAVYIVSLFRTGNVLRTSLMCVSVTWSESVEFIMAIAGPRRLSSASCFGIGSQCS